MSRKIERDNAKHRDYFQGEGGAVEALHGRNGHGEHDCRKKINLTLTKTTLRVFDDMLSEIVS